MADDRHSQCLLVAEDVRLAAALAEWLTEKGFPAEVASPGPVAEAGDSLGISEATHPGVEVRVTNPDHVAPAREAIQEKRDEILAIREQQAKRAARTGTVTAVCEDCGKPSEWPAAVMGTTEVCPHCTGYMDVPDPDENWDDVDFGSEDADAEPPHAD